MGVSFFKNLHKKLFVFKYIFWIEAVDKLMISGSSVASMLNLFPSAVSKLASRGRKDSHREKIETNIFDLNSYENKGEQA